jgi:hypothetical protein
VLLLPSRLLLSTPALGFGLLEREHRIESLRFSEVVSGYVLGCGLALLFCY